MQDGQESVRHNQRHHHGGCFGKLVLPTAIRPGEILPQSPAQAVREGMNTKRLAALAYSIGYRVDDSGATWNRHGRRISSVDSYGYPALHLSLPNGHRTMLRVHRLQAYQKFGDAIFQPGVDVRHLNGNKLDNSASNIAIGTRSQNRMDMPRGARIASARNAANARYAKRCAVRISMEEVHRIEQRAA